ncbi:MAG: type 1 glutamine amidotransferase [Halodesulfurarchaeum sp.]
MAGEVARLLPSDEVKVYNYPNESGDPSLAGVDAVVVGGSEAGTYDEPDEPWITAQKEFLEEAVIDREIPLFGICFGHQLINEALGGEVVDTGTFRAHLVEADLGEDPLFAGVDSIVPVLHSDIVAERASDMEVIASTPYDDNFATRHVDKPIWTVQYHPEFTPEIKPEYEEVWEENEFSFADSNAYLTFENFEAVCC